jgi:hypothetical protein
MRYCHRFPDGIPHPEADIHVFLTRPPLPLSLRRENVRLACVRHAASVYPEPGSNSPSSVSSLHRTRRRSKKCIIVRVLAEECCCCQSFLAGSQMSVTHPPARCWCISSRVRHLKLTETVVCTVAASLLAGEKPVAVLHSTLQLLRFFTLKCLVIPFYRLLQ